MFFKVFGGIMIWLLKQTGCIQYLNDDAADDDDYIKTLSYINWLKLEYTNEMEDKGWVKEKCVCVAINFKF